MFRLAYSWLVGLLGAVLGGLVGYFIFRLLVRQGIYAMVLPGGLIGIGCGLLSRHYSLLRGLLCFAAALGWGLYCEWTVAPFVKDKTFGFFLRNTLELDKITLLFVLLGGLVSYWFGKSHYFTDRPAPKA